MTDPGSVAELFDRVASFGALTGPVDNAGAAAAKAAVEAFTVSLAKELAADSIRVNAVAPGTVWTEFHRDPDRPAKVAATIPMGRAGRPEEIAGAVAWLLSEDASYTTGTTLRITGGL